jgi:hypothetical protein
MWCCAQYFFPSPRFPCLCAVLSHPISPHQHFVLAIPATAVVVLQSAVPPTSRKTPAGAFWDRAERAIYPWQVLKRRRMKLRGSYSGRYRLGHRGSSTSPDKHPDMTSNMAEAASEISIHVQWYNSTMATYIVWASHGAVKHKREKNAQVSLGALCLAGVRGTPIVSSPVPDSHVYCSACFQFMLAQSSHLTNIPRFPIPYQNQLTLSE